MLNEGTDELLEERQEVESFSFMREVKEIFSSSAKELNELYAQGKEAEAGEQAAATIEEVRGNTEEYFGKEKSATLFVDYDQHLDELKSAEQSEDKDQANKAKILATEAVNFIPFVGSAKMIAEGAKGRELITGRELKGKERFMHTAEGAVFFALDFTGVGGVAGKAATRGGRLAGRSARLGARTSRGGRAARRGGSFQARASANNIKASQLFKRSAAMFRSMGVSRKASRPLFKFGKFLERNPALAKVADRTIQEGISRRNKRRSKLAGETGSLVFEYFDDDPSASDEQSNSETGSNQ